MAFLIPALTAGLEAAGLGAAGGLGSWLVNKIVGDAPADLETVSAIITDLAAQPDAPLTTRGADPALTTELLKSRVALQNSTPQVVSSFRQQMSGLLSAARNASSMANQVENRVASQGASDAAALLVASPSLAHQVIGQQMQQTPSQLQQQQLQSGRSLVQGNSSSLLPAQYPSYSPMTTPNSGFNFPVQNPITAPQPPAKLLTNQAVNIPPATAENPAVSGSIKDTIAAAASNALPVVENAAVDALSHMGTAALSGVKTAAKSAAGDLLANAGKSLSSGGSGVWSSVKNVLGNIATKLSRKIVGDAPPDIIDKFSNRLLKTKEFYKPAGNALRQILPKNHMLYSLSEDDVFGPDLMDEKIVGDAPWVNFLHNKLGTEGNINGKVVGDAPWVSKIVGDAPPMMSGMDDTMTDAQVEAAVLSMTESRVFTLFSLLIAEEQLFTMGTRYERVPAEALWGDVARDAEPSDAAFKRSDIARSRTVAGKAFIFADEYVPLLHDYSQAPDALVPDPAGGADPINNAYFINTANYVRYRVGLKTADQAPPVILSQTLQAMMPLAVGADLTQYSSSLRLNTPTLNYDLQARFVATLTPYLSSSKGYSFSLPLLKMLLYFTSQSSIPGDEMQQYMSGLYEQWNFVGHNPRAASDANVFPLDVEAWSNNPDMGGWGNSAGQLAVITDAVYMAVTAGLEQTHTWQDNFRPINWGKTCSVIFIPRERASEWQFVACCYLSQAAYPFLCMTREGTRFFPTADGNLRELNRAGSPDNGHSLKDCVQIEGPTWYHLFVVVGAAETEAFVALSGDRVITVADNGPDQPVLIGDDVWTTLYDTIVNDVLTARFTETGPILDWIKWWEVTFGSASDRSSAVRLASQFDRLWGLDCFIGNGQLPGQQLLVADWRSFGPGAWGGGGYNPGRALDVTTGIPIYLWALRTPNFALPSVVHRSGTYHPESLSYIDVFPNTPYYYISRENHDVSLLCVQGHAAPLEEYPAHRLDSATTLSYSMAMMNTLMAGIADLGMQSANMNIAGVYHMNQGSSPTDKLYYKQKHAFLPQILQYGIQYPQASFSLSAMNQSPSNNNMVMINEVFGDLIWEDSNIVSISRVPNTLLGTILPSVINNSSALTLASAVSKPRRELLDALPLDGGAAWAGGGIYIVNISDNDALLDNSLMMMSWPLSRGVVVTREMLTSSNYGVMIVGKGRTRGARLLFCMEKLDQVWAALLSKVAGAPDVTIPPITIAFLPHGELLRRRMRENGWGECRLMMTGPKELFNTTGAPSSAYDLYVDVVGASQVHVTSSWHWQDNFPFSTGDLTQVFQTF